jgi:hypothetical protein
VYRLLGWAEPRSARFASPGLKKELGLLALPKKLGVLSAKASQKMAHGGSQLPTIVRAPLAYSSGGCAAQPKTRRQSCVNPNGLCPAVMHSIAVALPGPHAKRRACRSRVERVCHLYHVKCRAEVNTKYDILAFLMGNLHRMQNI